MLNYKTDKKPITYMEDHTNPAHKISTDLATPTILILLEFQVHQTITTDMNSSMLNQGHNQSLMSNNTIKTVNLYMIRMNSFSICTLNSQTLPMSIALINSNTASMDLTMRNFMTAANLSNMRQTVTRVTSIIEKILNFIMVLP